MFFVDTAVEVWAVFCVDTVVLGTLGALELRALGTLGALELLLVLLLDVLEAVDVFVFVGATTAAVFEAAVLVEVVVPTVDI